MSSIAKQSTLSSRRTLKLHLNVFMRVVGHDTTRQEEGISVSAHQAFEHFIPTCRFIASHTARRRVEMIATVVVVVVTPGTIKSSRKSRVGQLESAAARTV